MKNPQSFFTIIFLSTIFSVTTIKADTKPGFNDAAIYRIQLKVKTNTIKNANTDSPVWVQLNAKDAPYYLDKSGDDREKGKTDVHEILSPNINKIRDIKMIKIGINGDDGWNFRTIELLVNGKSIYKKQFNTNGQWIDTDNKKHPSSYTINTSKLRSYRNWNYNNLTRGIETPPTAIPVTTIKSMIESAVGNTLSGMKKVVWGKKHGKDYVSIKRVSSNRLRVDLDLKAEVKLAPDAGVDVDFDLVFNCVNGVITTEIENYSAVAKGYEVELGPLTLDLRSVMLFECLIPGTGKCNSGLSMIEKGFDFNINYGSSTSSSSNALRLDFKGNLHLNNKTKKIKPNSFKNNTWTTVMISPIQTKK